MIKPFLPLFILFVVFSSNAQDIGAPTGLTVELLRVPDQAVITDSVPEFGWIFPEDGISQLACRILVATDPELLQINRADMWDSDKLETDNSINISYAGAKLQPGRSYFWKVKVWGANNSESSFSAVQKFNTGYFERDTARFAGYSDFVQLPDGNWVAENRQMATFSNIDPKSSEKTSDSTWFFDFGKAAFATLGFEATSANDDDNVTIYLGERKTGSTVHKNPGKTNIGFYKAKIDVQKGRHYYRVEIPRHEAHYPHSQKLPPFYPEVLPFRYVEIIGNSSIEINKINQEALFYYFDDQASSFVSPNEDLNKVWELCKYTLKATPFLGVYCDGNRERMPYEADAYIQQLGHYSVDREYSAAAYTIAFLLSHASWPTEWQMHAVMMAREHYMYTGDTELLAEFYEILKTKTLLALSDENGLISTRTGKVTPKYLQSLHFNGGNFGDIVDWPPGTPEGQQQSGPFGNTVEGERDGYVFTDYNTVVNAFHFYSLKCMEEIAGALNKTEDEQFFQNRKEKVRSAILENMFDEERGIFTDGIGTQHASLHANMFPLAFNLVPEKLIPSVAAFIKTRGMACSVYGAQYLLEALYNAGEAEYALKMMTKDDKRSWMNMLRVGSTMTTEAWDEYFKPNLTWNHAWGSAPANIIPRRLMGIQPLEAGWETFVVNPQPNGLENIEVKIPCVRGEIECKLKATENQWQMELSVPGNSEALVLLPSEMPTIEADGSGIRSEAVIEYLGRSRNLIRMKSGKHKISIKK